MNVFKSRKQVNLIKILSLPKSVTCMHMEQTLDSRMTEAEKPWARLFTWAKNNSFKKR